MSGHRMTTLPTQKLRLAFAILLFAMPAHAACSAGVSGVNQDDRHTCQDRLVHDEAAKLIETPTVVPCPLSLSNGRPLAYPAEILQRDSSIRVFGFLDKGLRDYMVHVGPKAFLLSSDSTEVALGRWGSNRLKRGTTQSVPLALGFDDLSAEAVAVRGSGYFDDPKVNPQNVVHQRLVALWNVAGRQQIEAALAIDEIALASLVGQHTSVGTSHAVRDAGASVERPDRDLPALRKVLQYPAVVDDGSTRSKLMLSLLVGLVGVGYLTQTTDDDLGRLNFEKVFVSQAYSDMALQAALDVSIVASNIAACSPVGLSRI